MASLLLILGLEVEVLPSISRAEYLGPWDTHGNSKGATGPSNPQLGSNALFWCLKTVAVYSHT